MGSNLTDDVIELRPLTLDDAAEHLAGEDGEWERWLSGGPGSLEGVTRAIDRWIDQWRTNGPIRNFGIWNRATDQLLGNIEINLSGTLVGVGADEANVAYGVFSFARGGGIATRSIDLACAYLQRDEPGIVATVIRVEPENVGSVAVARRSGFQLDGEVPGDRGVHMLRFVRTLVRLEFED